MCDALCSVEDVEVQKCLSVDVNKIVLNASVSNRQMILKYIEGINKGKLASNENGELHIFSSYNDSGWCVKYLGNCGEIYAVEPVLYTAGQIFGAADLLSDFLWIPPVPPFVTDFFSKCMAMSNNLKLISKYVNNISEKISSFIFLNFHQLHAPTFQEKIEFVRQMFLMLDRLARSTFGELLMCDIHLNNFGYTTDGKVVLIDGDHLYYIDQVQKILSRKKCTDDSDCTIGDFADCQSICDTTTNHCTTNVPLSNVRVVSDVLLSIIFYQLSDEEHARVIKIEKMLQEFKGTNQYSVRGELNQIDNLLDLIDKVDYKN